MEYKSKAQKLLELRTKTDRELFALIDGLIERGHGREAERLLSVLSGPDRRLLERKLNEFQKLSAAKSVYAA